MFKEQNTKNLVIALRLQGKSYSEISNIIGTKIPKSTLSYWFRGLELPDDIKQKQKDASLGLLLKAREKAKYVKQTKRKRYLESVFLKNHHLEALLKKQDIAKVVIASLYLGEGTKDPARSSLVFANSDPRVIWLFLTLLRHSYTINENSFRCTVQCRADQNTEELMDFWSRITNIPRARFYKTQVDYRTIDKPTRKPDYKGVCRIDYFSASVFIDILTIITIITARARSSAG